MLHLHAATGYGAGRALQRTTGPGCYLLLDALDAQYTFDLPPSLLTQEFENIWRQVQNDMTEQGKTFADEDTSEEEARAEYQKIAERRGQLIQKQFPDAKLVNGRWIVERDGKRYVVGE
jgi:hypothetical protein